MCCNVQLNVRSLKLVSGNQPYGLNRPIIMMIPTWRGRLEVKKRKIPNQNSYHLKKGVNHKSMFPPV